jgi:release factor glutamine methyltransferase
VFAEDEARLLAEAAQTPDALEAMLRRREAGEPLEYVVGWVEFCGLRVSIDIGVFVPRQRTGLLVRQAVALTPAGGTIVDLACGSGAVGLAVAYAVPGVTLHAVDVEPVAVRCARRNLAPVGGHVYEGDLYAPLPSTLRGRVDVLVANVPYVPSGAVDLMPREARDHEPRVTLDGGPDGLDVLRRVARSAPEWLAPGGYVLVEIGGDQSDPALDAFVGLAPTIVGDDELYATVVLGRSRPTERPDGIAAG